MKVEKISKNKAVIMITSKELNSRKITLKDIKEGNIKARNFFLEILEDSMLHESIEIQASKLLIEVFKTSNNMFKITITAADIIPDEDLATKFKRAEKTIYTISSDLYKFENIRDLYAFIQIALEENLYLGNNSLYILDGKYYLHFLPSTINNPGFVKTFGVVSEYSSKYYSNKSISFFEHGVLVLKNNAIQSLSKI